MAAKEEIDQNEHFLLSSPCVQLYSIIVLFPFYLGYFFKVVWCRLVVCGKGFMINNDVNNKINHKLYYYSLHSLSRALVLHSLSRAVVLHSLSRAVVLHSLSRAVVLHSLSRAVVLHS